MESIIKDDILAYMVSNKLLTNLQHGFVPGKSCQSNLLLMLNFLTESIENGTDADLVYLDFAKAFDSVPHNRLICKLHNYGFSGHLLLWIRNFLSHRRQKVRVNNTLSNWENVSSSVPQGSVFGPILFIIYINDLPRYKMFADDTKLMQKLISTTSHNELQDDINRLIEWSKKWELKFNTSKCKVMHFGNDISNSYTMLDFNNQKRKKLEFITKEKDGVIIDHKLNFSSHTVTQVKKTNKMMGLIRRSYTHLDITSFRYLFSSLVRPHLEYCISIWYLLLKKDEELIENVLRRATKLIKGLYDKPYKVRLAAIKVPSMRYHRMWGDMILVYKILCGGNQSLRDL